MDARTSKRQGTIYNPREEMTRRSGGTVSQL